MKIRRFLYAVIAIFALQIALTSCTERSVDQNGDIQIEMTGDEANEPAEMEDDEEF